MEIRVEIPESDINRIEVGQKVLLKQFHMIVVIIKLKLRVLIQQIRHIAMISTRGTTSSNTKNPVYYYAKFHVDNNENRLKISMSIENSIIIDEIDVLTIPQMAIRNDQDGKYVLVKQDDEKIKKRIKTGLNDGISVDKGLKEGDEISYGVHAINSQIKLNNIVKRYGEKHKQPF